MFIKTQRNKPGKRNRWATCTRVILLVLSILVLPLVSYGAEPEPEMDCQDTFPDLVNDICWKCTFPLRIGGTVVMNQGGMEDNVGANPDDYNPGSIVCTCTHPTTGLPDIGTYISYWEPLTAIELIQQPGCFSLLFGMDLSGATDFYGAQGQAQGQGNTTDKSFYNAHLYSFPLMAVMDMLYGTDYCNNWSGDIDLAYFTEADPAWNDDELAIYITPEAVIFANPVAQVLGSVDCLAASAGYPLNSLFWTAGCWGSMYPFTGNSGVIGSPVRSTSLLAARLLAKFARVPIPPVIELDTSSLSAKCKPQFLPFFKKSQYRFSTLYPIPETTGKCCHSLGSSPFIWGEWRNIPGTGENQVYMIAKKKNCCLKLY